MEPTPWFCYSTFSESYANLAYNAKHGTRHAGWYKPDLIAVSTNITSPQSHDRAVNPQGSFCVPDDYAPNLPSAYDTSSGTSFAAPAAAGAAVLASRRFHPTPGAATPALIKAMLIAGAASMRDGKDRARTPRYDNRMNNLRIGDRVIPKVSNGHVYEVEWVTPGGSGDPDGDPTNPQADPEPTWPTDGGTVSDGTNTQPLIWRDKGPEATIGAFPNSQQGFGRIALHDVLSDYPMRDYINETENLIVGQSWTREYVVHDADLPVRIALAWTDLPKMFAGDVSADPPLVNNLNLSVEVRSGGTCVGRYIGNALGATEESLYYQQQPCTTGTHDTLNNVEIARFFPTGARGDITFTVKVAFATGSGTQNFGLVVWNAYRSTTVTPPPPHRSLPRTRRARPKSRSPGLRQAARPTTRSSGASASLTLMSRSRKERRRVSPTQTAPPEPPTSTVCAQVTATGFSEWAIDPATTVPLTDPTLTSGLTTIKAVHLTQLRTAAGSLRAAAGLGSTAWTDAPLVAGVTTVAGRTCSNSAPQLRRHERCCNSPRSSTPMRPFHPALQL